jgi:hypothetical protein
MTVKAPPRGTSGARDTASPRQGRSAGRSLAQGNKGEMSGNAGSDVRAAYLFISPAIIGFTVFVVYPLIRPFYLALTKYPLRPKNLRS